VSATVWGIGARPS